MSRLLPLLALLLPGLAAAQPAPQPATQPCPPAALQTANLPTTRITVAHGAPLTVVAFGSSSTEGAASSGPEATYPAQLEARLHAALPGLPLVVLNRGKGGQEVHEMLARLETDVLAEHPALVIWQAGANAVLQGMPAEEFQAALAGGVARLQAAGADVLLMDSQRAPRILQAPGFERLDAAIGGLAAATSAELFSRAALMRDWEAAGTPSAEMISPDGLHHNDRGYACVAEALARTIVAAAGPLPAPAQMAKR